MSILESTHQHTVGATVLLVGIGLHTGRHTAVRIRPAPADHGIRFYSDAREMSASEGVRARWDNVVDTTLCTTLGDGDGRRFSTVEHLLAAMHGCGIDNARVEVTGGEVPIMDGSAAAFIGAINSVGAVTQAAARRVLVVRRPVAVSDGSSVALVSPAPSTRFTVEIDFDDEVIGHQSFSFDLEHDDLETAVGRARTFGFVEDLERLHAAGLALAGSPRNAVVIASGKVVNRTGLRFADEFARHKVLDLVGDTVLAGVRVRGHFYGFRTGHRLNCALLRSLMLDTSAWSIHSFEERLPNPSGDRLAELLASPRSRGGDVAGLLLEEIVARRSGAAEGTRE